MDVTQLIFATDQWQHGCRPYAIRVGWRGQHPQTGL